MFYSEPTSVPKATRILPAIASALDIHTRQSPVAFASPNLLELAALYHAAQAEPLALTEHAHWWDVTDALGLGADWRMAVDAVARQTARAGDASAGTLDFLVRDGAARMAVGLLPFYQRLVIKCGARGVLVALRVVGEARGAWAPVRSNAGARIAVSHAGADTVVLRHFPALALADGEMVNSTGAGDSLVGSLLADLVRDPGVLDDPHSLERAVDRAQRAAILTLQSPLAVSPLLSELV
jgi:pseudouridine-5'-phosphate glycosidase/pseudouridine kinase